MTEQKEKDIFSSIGEILGYIYIFIIILFIFDMIGLFVFHQKTIIDWTSIPIREPY